MLDDKENNASRIQFMQQIVDKNDSKMHTCLQIDLELNIDFILFQESFVNTNTMTTISHSAYYCIMPESEKIRPRVIIDINDSLNSKTEVIQLINIYNEKSLAENNNE